LKDDEISSFFSPFEKIIEFHSITLLNELKSVIDSFNPLIGNLFQNENFKKLKTLYIENLLSSLYTQMNTVQKNKLNENEMNLKSIPFKQITIYQQLLYQILICTTKDHVDYDNLETSFNNIYFIYESILKYENIKSLNNLKAKFQNEDNFMNIIEKNSRKLINYSTVHLKLAIETIGNFDGEYYLYLFNDIFFIISNDSKYYMFYLLNSSSEIVEGIYIN
jgi:hypothetical protein